MAAISGVIAQATPSSDEEFLSPDEKEDLWTYQKDIGVGGFGIVKLFVNKVRAHRLVEEGCLCLLHWVMYLSVQFGGWLGRSGAKSSVL